MLSYKIRIITRAVKLRMEQENITAEVALESYTTLSDEEKALILEEINKEVIA